MRFGISLPHYSEYCTQETLLGLAAAIESYGFDSVWVRDHVAYEPKKFDPPGRLFVEPFVALSAIAALTDRLRLGFAVAIPSRPPAVLANLTNSLTWISRGRAELGVGIGSADEFERAGLAAAARIRTCEESLGLLRGRPLGAETALDPDSWLGPFIWYGSTSAAGIARAIKFCDGIIASRTPLPALDRLIAQVSRVPDRHALKVATVPLLALGRTRQEAVELVRQRWPMIKRLSDHAEIRGDRLAGVEGAVIFGTSQDCVDQLGALVERRVELVVLDPRLDMGHFADTVHQLGEEVLPSFGALTSRSEKVSL